ncbi:MAG TPA: hybrid sensor histidine kinase/response regulator [Labilithrix sp.]|nr:hybrid sensor histidine kinase/response regulator [Labilithrix sp.]
MKLKNDSVKFLLVDDKEENLVALEALLRRDGLELLKARSGDEALELLLVHDVALALLDVHMPDMDGFALAELMRGAQRSRHVPIIFVTAAPQEQHREFRGYDAGAVDFLFKPLDPRILRHKTETFYQLHRQKQQLEETLHLAETFMAAVGHDLKTPLNAVVLGAELILMNPTSESNRKTAERLKASSRHMQRMIDDLFDLARARLAGGIPVSFRPTDFLHVVRRSLTDLEATHSDVKITLSERGGATGEWDSDRLYQVVSNLLTNAVRHGTKGRPITVRLEGSEDDVTLAVHNEGAIAEDVREHLFDPFRSSSQRRGREEGLGLGLYIAQQIVLVHGGTLDVETSPVTGTTFRVTLPRRPPAPPS